MKQFILLGCLLILGCDEPPQPIGEVIGEAGNSPPCFSPPSIKAVQNYEYNGHRYFRFNAASHAANEMTPVHDPDCPKCLNRLKEVR